MPGVSSTRVRINSARRCTDPRPCHDFCACCPQIIRTAQRAYRAQSDRPTGCSVERVQLDPMALSNMSNPTCVTTAPKAASPARAEYSPRTPSAAQGSLSAPSPRRYGSSSRPSEHRTHDCVPDREESDAGTAAGSAPPSRPRTRGRGSTSGHRSTTGRLGTRHGFTDRKFPPHRRVHRTNKTIRSTVT